MIASFAAKLRDAFQSVFPMFIAVFITALILNIPLVNMVDFLIGSAFLVIGLALFSLGSQASVIPIGSSIGSFIVQRRNLYLFVAVSFIAGFFITLAEPSLWVLADQLKGVVLPLHFIIAIAVGIGFFVVIGLLRILLQFPLRYLFILSYGLVLILSLFTPSSFVPISFDTGGITTGPMAVPFIMSLALGLSQNRGDKKAEEDSFGLVGISIIGPVLSVITLGFFIPVETPVMDLTTTLWEYGLNNLTTMIFPLLPFIGAFLFLEVGILRFSQKQIIQKIIAFVYTYLGLVFFLTGANGGLANLGYLIGHTLAMENHLFWIVALGMVFGLLIIFAEPGVMALNRQVEQISAGAISSRLMYITLSFSVALALGIAMVRLWLGFDLLWILIPGYLIAMALTFFTPVIFAGIAIDSSAAVSGVLNSAFLVPFAFGVAEGFNLNILHDAFGVVALVSLAPIIAVQWLGIAYRYRKSSTPTVEMVDDIVNLEEETV